LQKYVQEAAKFEALVEEVVDIDSIAPATRISSAAVDATIEVVRRRRKGVAFVKASFSPILKCLAGDISRYEEETETIADDVCRVNGITEQSNYRGEDSINLLC
jgi:hypothetical protein